MRLPILSTLIVGLFLADPNIAEAEQGAPAWHRFLMPAPILADTRAAVPASRVGVAGREPRTTVAGMTLGDVLRDLAWRRRAARDLERIFDKRGGERG